MGLTNIKSWFNAYYDKLLAFAALALLLASLIYLAVSVGKLKEEQAVFQREQQMLRPRFPKAAPPDLHLFEEGIYVRGEPYKIVAPTNFMFTPERRVSCLNCDRPIAYVSTNCPYCKAVQQTEPSPSAGGDRDNDGLPDAWEVKYGLNPLFAGDAVLDSDGDGFTNIDEYRNQTSPVDKTDHPTRIGRVRVVSMTELPFDLIFKAVSKNPQGDLVFQLNLRLKERTFFKKLGEEATNFKLVDYNPAFTGNGGKKLQVLTLQRGDKRIRLIKGLVTPWQEYEVKLADDIDKNEFTVIVDSEFSLGNEKYQVKQIDSSAKRILIRAISGGKETWVEQRAPEEKTDDQEGQQP